MASFKLSARIFCAVIILLCTAGTSFAQVPVITGFSPHHGHVGSTVTITGSNFSSINNSIVRFGNVAATINSISATQIVVTVPAGASYAPISYTVKDNYTAWSSKPFTQTFNPGPEAAFVPTAFRKRLEAGAGSDPSSICTADIDGDGKPDVMVANLNSNNISVYRNTSANGIMSFEGKKDYPVGALPWFVTAADINNDGQADILVANRNSNTISVFENFSSEKTINLKKRDDIATGSNPQCIAVTDVNQDGKPDIVVVNYLSNNVSVYTSQGKSFIQFNAPVNYTVGAGPFSLAVADFNGDGRPDIATANSTANNVSILIGTGTGSNSSFVNAATLAVGHFPEHIAAGDLNDDGRPDLVVTNSFSKSISVLKNLTGSTLFFEPKQDIVVGATPGGIAIADMNGDAKPDIAIATRSQHVLVFRNTTVNKVFSVDAKATYTAGSLVGDLAVGDLDGDKKPDIALTDDGAEAFSVVRNQMNEPVIKLLRPATVMTGDTVHISGANFTGTTAVSFGGPPAYNFKVTSDTTIMAVVGQAQNGSVVVTSTHGFDWRDGFTYKGYCAASGSVSTSGGLDTIIVNGVTVNNRNLNGYGNFLNNAPLHLNLGLNEASVKNIFALNRIAVYIDYNRDGDFDDKDELVFKSVDRDYSVTKSFKFNVPPTAVAGLTTMRVRVFYGSEPEPCGRFQIGETQDYGVVLPKMPPPQIHSFSPAVAGPGDVVTIKGEHFDGATEVSFGGTKVFHYNVNSAKEIVATVDTGSTGDVLVKTPVGGTATAQGFTFIPGNFKLTSFSPAKAGPYQEITILGTGFKNIRSVHFGTVNAYSFRVVSPEMIIASIIHAESGKITVTDAINRKDSLPGFTYLPYCIPYGGSLLYITNSVSIDTAVYANDINDIARYKLYNNKITPLRPGAHTLTLNIGSNSTLLYYAVYCRAFIDLNQDGKFDNNEQIAYQRLLYGNAAPALNFNVFSTTTGVTRLRIIYFIYESSYDASSCMPSHIYGETQDYLVDIKSSTGRVGADDITQAVKQGMQPDGFTVQALPNPSKNSFVLAVNSDDKQRVELRVTDMAGRVLYQASGAANDRYTFGSSFATGMYIAEVVQGTKVKKVKLVKVR